MDVSKQYKFFKSSKVCTKSSFGSYLTRLRVHSNADISLKLYMGVLTMILTHADSWHVFLLLLSWALNTK